MRSDFAVCREMGWTLPELDALPVDAYHALIEWLGEQWRDAKVRE